jgi:iron complex outermembrane receptor protein
LRFGHGRARDTGFDAQQHSLLFGVRNGRGLLTADLGLTRTRDAGTPALPMDMIQDDGRRARLTYAHELDSGLIECRAYRHEADHLMDNYSLRPAGTNRVSSPTESDDTGWETRLTWEADADLWRGGFEFHRNDFVGFQRQDGTGARQDSIRDAERNRFGAYAEWQRDWTDRWQTLVGVRQDTVWSDAGEIQAFFPAAAADRLAFNARARDVTALNLEASLALRYRVSDGLSLEVALARKSRAPSLLERYLWTPLNASAGQADGRTYLGNTALDPEVSHQVAATLDWRQPTWGLAVTPFFNRVQDYIQGTPVARKDVQGRPVLEFQNQPRVELYGFEGLAWFGLTANLDLRSTVSFTRGRNLSAADNLYRLAPLRGTVALRHRWRSFSSEAEAVWASNQADVAAYNQERPTPGHAALNLRTTYAWRNRLTLQLAVENVFDKVYADHLNGINRVSASDVPVGARLPAYGRSVLLSVAYRW